MVLRKESSDLGLSRPYLSKLSELPRSSAWIGQDQRIFVYKEFCMKIKAIETVYNGYRFRSRLEARRAVFFDTLGVKYEYEPEGYVLPDGTCYLPDFYLPIGGGIYLEVKGKKPTSEEYKKAELLGVGLDKPIVIAVGLPGENWGELCDQNEHVPLGWYDAFPALYLPELRWCFAYDKSRIFDYKKFDMSEVRADSNLLWVTGLPYGTRAVLAAKQARFEHGEVKR